jgi:imidazoleglycerol-phosphate dehydratase
MRRARIVRRTNETSVTLSLLLEGTGRARVSTGIGFLDHMLELLARHGGFDLDLQAKGDLHVDQHHTVEDVGISLGQAFERALGTKRGILRAGYFVMPMDETLGVVAIDFG